jgi:hypothetical protein
MPVPLLLRLIVEFDFDFALLRAMLTIIEQAAHEMGEWDTPLERTVGELGAMPSNVVILPREDSGI